MNSTFSFILTATALLVLVSCSPKSGSSIRAQGKSSPNPQVTDILKGKSSIEKLNTKYGGENGQVKATCTLTSEKVTAETPPVETPQVQLGKEVAKSASSVKPPGFVPPIQYPEQDVVVFDIRAQSEVDKDLSQPVELALEHEKAEQLVKVNIVLEPVKFEEGVSLSLGRVKYIMKHTPVLEYKYTVELQGAPVTPSTTTSYKVYEKVLTKDLLAQTQIGADNYQHFLSCSINTTVNDSNEELAREFQSQWRCIDCMGPQ